MERQRKEIRNENSTLNHAIRRILLTLIRAISVKWVQNHNCRGFEKCEHLMELGCKCSVERQGNSQRDMNKGKGHCLKMAEMGVAYMPRRQNQQRGRG